jgi:hypothetical protein
VIAAYRYSQPGEKAGNTTMAINGDLGTLVGLLDKIS